MGLMVILALPGLVLAINGNGRPPGGGGRVKLDLSSGLVPTGRPGNHPVNYLMAAGSKESKGKKPASKEKTDPAPKKKSTPAAKNSRASKADPDPLAKTLPPEKYYQLVLERQGLSISSYQQMLKILETHPKDPEGAARDLARHEEERQAKVNQLFQKYGISPEVYYRSYRATETQKARGRYLDAHQEIRNKLAENSKTITRLEAEVRAKIKVLKKIETPPPPKKKKQKVED